MIGRDLRVLRQSYGWTQRQVAAATHYSQGAIAHYERGLAPLPPPLVAWVRATPRCHQCSPLHRYSTTAAGLWTYLATHQMRVVELAAFCGVGERTVMRWLQRDSPVPRAVRAWLRSGAPATWRWGPPGADLPTYRDAPAARVRAEGRQIVRAPTLLRRQGLASPTACRECGRAPCVARQLCNAHYHRWQRQRSREHSA